MRNAAIVILSVTCFAFMAILVFSSNTPEKRKPEPRRSRVAEVLTEAEAKMNQAMTMLPGDPIGAAMLNAEVKGMLRAAQIVNSEDKP